MKAMLRSVNDHGTRYEALLFICPGCQADGYGSGLHMLPVNSSVKQPSWTWDGSLERPTLSPSILTRSTHKGEETICHGFLEGGRFRFLSDCTHSLVNQTDVEMPDLPSWVTDGS